LTEEVMSCYNTEIKSGGVVVSSPATYCMICQTIVYATYILDHGVYHCPTCVSETEINSITRAKAKREGRDTPDTRDLVKAYSDFRGVAFSDEDSKTRKVVQCKSIGCEHGTWNEGKTVWQWKEKWFCSICNWSCEDVGEVVKNKKTHEGFHKEKWDKLLASKKEGQERPKVAWYFREDRRRDDAATDAMIAKKIEERRRDE